MFNFLHTFHPSPILVSLGPIHVYWYGFFIVLGVLAALTVAIYLAKFYQIKTDTMIDLALWLVIGGILGARLYDIFLEWPYFSSHPLDILKIWQGGLAIHGGIIGGAISLWLFTLLNPTKSAPSDLTGFTKKDNHNFWRLATIAVTALPLAQAFGRWGNYFNQELFGRPTSLPWGIPIDQIHRPWQYLNYDYFHPAFLYESMGNLLIFIILISLQVWFIKKQKLLDSNFLILTSYFLLYSLLRFSTEFLRIDATPTVLGWRWPQLVSLFIIISCLAYLAVKIGRKISSNSSSNSTLDK